MIYERLTCRLCGDRVRPVFALTPTPIANAFPARPDAGAERYRLELAQCRACAHVQVRDVVPDALLYADYRYETPAALAPELAGRARALRRAYPQARRVLEIGSNNGLFLDALLDAGFDAFGIDPAAPPQAKNAIRAPFGAEVAANLGAFDLVLANNVLAHIDDLDDVFRGIERVLAWDGALVFEVQYLPALVASGAFDMIYHEHRDYHTVAPLKAFLRRYGLRMTRADMIPEHGGSVRITADRGDLELWGPSEAPIDWSAFAELVNAAKAALLEQLDGCAPVVAFGATAKACTLIHHFGIAASIAYCVDSTPAKQGRYIAGTDILIRGMDALPPDGSPVLLTAWNHAEIIKRKYPQFDYIEPFKEIA